VGLISFADCFEALPFSVPLNFASGTGDAPINEVCNYKYRQCRSYHRAPSFQLSSHIDSHVTAQMLIFVFALEISFTGVNMSFILVVKVVLGFIFGHHITSWLFGCWFIVFRPSWSKVTAHTIFGNMSRLAVWW
jgi:hypothetical protein